MGTHHNFSPEHLDRYVNEFASRINHKDIDTEDILTLSAINSTGKYLPYKELIHGTA